MKEMFDYGDENSEPTNELRITNISFHEFQNMTDDDINPNLTLILAFEVPDWNLIPFNFILSTLVVGIKLKVLLGSLFRWRTISRDFTSRLIPIFDDEYGGLI